jgi:transketolase N-terminal domain/subunit
MDKTFTTVPERIYMPTQQSSDVTYLKCKTHEAKRKVLEMCLASGLGHITSAYSCAEICFVLYYNFLRNEPQNPQ